MRAPPVRWPAREQAGLRVPCRLMTLAVSADATAAADDGDGPAPSSLSPLCLLWEVGSTPAGLVARALDDGQRRTERRGGVDRLGRGRGRSTRAGRRRAADRRCAPRRVCCLSRRASSPRSKTRRPKGRAAARGAVDGGGARAQRLNAWSLRLFDVYTLQPLGRCTLELMMAIARVPVAIARCAGGRGARVVGGARGRRRRPAWSLLAAHRVPARLPVSPTALRASGARLAPAAAGGAARRPSSRSRPPPRASTANGVDGGRVTDVHRRPTDLDVHAMRCAGARRRRVGRACRRRSRRRRRAPRARVDLMGSGPDGEGTALPADGGGGAVAEAAASAAAAGLAAAVGRGARERRPRALRRAGAAVQVARAARRCTPRALLPPARSDALPARALLEDVTGRLNEEDDMTPRCARSCHADDAPGSARRRVGRRHRRVVRHRDDGDRRRRRRERPPVWRRAQLVGTGRRWHAEPGGGARERSAPRRAAGACGGASDTQAARALHSATPAPLTFHGRFSGSLRSTGRAGASMSLRARRLRRGHRRLAPQRVLEAGAPLAARASRRRRHGARRVLAQRAPVGALRGLRGGAAGGC